MSRELKRFLDSSENRKLLSSDTPVTCWPNLSKILTDLLIKCMIPCKKLSHSHSLLEKEVWILKTGWNHSRSLVPESTQILKRPGKSYYKIGNWPLRQLKKELKSAETNSRLLSHKFWIWKVQLKVWAPRLSSMLKNTWQKWKKKDKKHKTPLIMHQNAILFQPSSPSVLTASWRLLPRERLKEPLKWSPKERRNSMPPLNHSSLKSTASKMLPLDSSEQVTKS